MSLEAPFADLEHMLTDVTMSMLANVIVTPQSGVAFPAQFDVGSTDFFESARGCDFTLRYAGAGTLARGEIVTIAGSPLVADDIELQVAEKPRPQGAGYEFIAPLVRV